MLLLLNYPIDLSSYAVRLLDVLVILAGLSVLALSGVVLLAVWFFFFRRK